MFEHKKEKLAPLPRFVKRVALAVCLALLVLSIALGIGVIGYHSFASLSWIDSILNASMILTGMGPVNVMKDAPAKLFASGYAVFSGVVFLSSIGFILAPIFHRIMHSFHLAEEDLVWKKRRR